MRTKMPYFNINWNITRACNLRCKHCYYDASTPLEDELSTEQALEVIDEIATTFGSNARVTFGGGEPLMRKDLLEIIAYGHERGLHLMLASNGILLDDDRAVQLKNAGIEEVIIAIDGTQRTHDAIRGNGIFERTVKGARACKAAGLDLVVDPCIMKLNERETAQILDITEQLDARQCRFFHYIAMGRGQHELPDGELDSIRYAENLTQLYEEQNKRRGIEICTTQASQYWVVLKRKEDAGLFVPDFYYNEAPGCRAGIQMLSIKPNGDVVPCPLLEVKVGNLMQTSLRAIMDSSILVNLRIRALKGKCAVCKFKQLCGGCRVRAYRYSGDYLAEDPLCSEVFFEEAQV
ncbi:MAG: radical SAM protein [Methanophagales archaeon ANME-1-THS]|nr:MAG: radical SAM protein [Methanophagales archaeon ANME-1-THS]